MLEFDPDYYPHASRRTVVYAGRGMVAASQPQAAQAGLDILKKGGNAVDAAIAAAACLTVTEPTSNGIGSDAFALVWMKGKLFGLNASGPAPRLISIDKVQEMGYSSMPKYGWVPVTVPGTPSAWTELSGKFGKLPLSEVIAPAVTYAREGFPVSPVTAFYWKKAWEKYSKELKGKEFSSWFEVFTPRGRPPKAGEIWKSPFHADTLEKIAETSARSFYEGDLADKIDAASRNSGGFLRKEDLASYRAEWVNPISINYRGYDVWEIPPNGQGLVALMALNIVRDDDISLMDASERYHLQIEAMKLAFTDGLEHITQPQDMRVSVESLLSRDYAASRRRLISGEAMTPRAGAPQSSGTVYLAAADGEGNMVSYIQSNYMGFGSGIVVPGTGIALQNRGENFSLDRLHVNFLEPGKQTYHTIIPGFITRDNVAVGPFGVMGAFMQPQGHMQVVMNTIDFSLNPQAALDAPRWQWMQGKEVYLEQTVPHEIILELERKGHKVRVLPSSSTFGRGQIIWRNSETGVLAGGTEPRTDGTIASW